MGKENGEVALPRPQYVSFDCYGTLISFEITSTTRRLLAGRSAGRGVAAFKKVFRGYRFDEVCGDYKPYEQILQDSFDRVCKRSGALGRPKAPAKSSLRPSAAGAPTGRARRR